MSSHEQFVIFELGFHGREPELGEFSKEFNNMQWVSKHIHRLGPEGLAYWGGAPAELVVFVLSVAANILTISKILADRVSRGHDSIIRIGEKEIQLKGKWKAEEIANLIASISKKTSKEEALKHIAKIKSAKTREAKKELDTIKDNIRQYEKLIQIFYELPKKEKPHKEKLKEYQKKLAEFQKQEEYLNSFIDFLKQEEN